ncbi:MAG: phosphotransferase [Ignavibacteria bacterium]|nr:phosphotransferase [Ignavibacteria bacterium]
MELSPAELKANYSNLLDLHVKYFGSGIKEYKPVSSHGSDRVIVRLFSESGSTSIGIINPFHIAENKAFISFGRHFRTCGLNIPEIYTVSQDEKLYLLEDLGDESLFNRITSGDSFNDEKKDLYKRVFEELPKFQITAGKDIDFSLCYQFGEFGSDNIDLDLNYFRERFLNNFYKGTVDSINLDKDLELLKSELLELPRDYFLYRDFQSRNVMIKGSELYFIDFQSGRKGALLYDAASMLYDAKANIPQKVREELLAYYLEVLSGYVRIDLDYFNRTFWYFAMIRILQAMGAYGFLGLVKGKSRFLESIPYALKNINFILNERIPRNEFNYLKQIFSELEMKIT